MTIISQGRAESVYDKHTNKLHHQNTATQHEGLGVMVICKIAAEGIKTIAFHKVIVSTRRLENDGSELMEQHSRFVRFIHCRCR